MTELWRRPVQTPAPDASPLTEEQASKLHAELGSAWSREETSTLRRTFEFKTFSQAFALTSRIALLAEKYSHHPHLELGWGYVRVALTTHSVGGLSENDFIMAAKIGRLS